MILEALPDSPGFGLSHFLNGGYEITYPNTEEQNGID